MIVTILHSIQMETEMIDKLDVFISGGMGDAKYRVMLYQMWANQPFIQSSCKYYFANIGFLNVVKLTPWWKEREVLPLLSH